MNKRNGHATKLQLPPRPLDVVVPSVVEIRLYLRWLVREAQLMRKLLRLSESNAKAEESRGECNEPG